MIHEDFIEQYFTADNEAALCKALDAGTLQHAQDRFEDTRTEEQVNDMLAKLHTANVTPILYKWSDDTESYSAV